MWIIASKSRNVCAEFILLICVFDFTLVKSRSLLPYRRKSSVHNHDYQYYCLATDLSSHEDLNSHEYMRASKMQTFIPTNISTFYYYYYYLLIYKALSYIRFAALYNVKRINYNTKQEQSHRCLSLTTCHATFCIFYGIVHPPWESSEEKSYQENLNYPKGSGAFVTQFFCWKVPAKG